MNDSEYQQKLMYLKQELANSLLRLEHVVLEINDLTQRCSASINAAKQTLAALERQIYVIQKQDQEPSKKLLENKQSSVLIVEDDSNIRELLKDFVSSRGCAAVIADDGHEAILAFQKEHFDLVLLDLRLPRISGVEVLKKIKEISPSTPVAVVTGNSEELQGVRDRALRPQWVIPKPFKLQQIDEALNMIGSK